MWPALQPARRVSLSNSMARKDRLRIQLEPIRAPCNRFKPVFFDDKPIKTVIFWAWKVWKKRIMGRVILYSATLQSFSLVILCGVCVHAARQLYKSCSPYYPVFMITIGTLLMSGTTALMNCQIKINSVILNIRYIHFLLIYLSDFWNHWSYIIIWNHFYIYGVRSVRGGDGRPRFWVSKIRLLDFCICWLTVALNFRYTSGKISPRCVWKSQPGSLGIVFAYLVILSR